jgi:hypothetical protein
MDIQIGQRLSEKEIYIRITNTNSCTYKITRNSENKSPTFLRYETGWTDNKKKLGRGDHRETQTYTDIQTERRSISVLNTTRTALKTKYKKIMGHTQQRDFINFLTKIMGDTQQGDVISLKKSGGIQSQTGW